jgi:hypothetical protein
LKIVNLTPYRFVVTGGSYYQFDVFDFADVQSGKARQNTVVYTTKVTTNHVDGDGEAYYRLEGTDKTFTIRGATRISDLHPCRTVVDLRGMGLGQREYGKPQQETSVTLVITGSESYGYISSLNFGPNNWMRQLYPVIRDRELRHVVMPGSHDAGMSTISKAWYGLGSSSNTQNQGLSIYDQLRVGSRWFDMRIGALGEAPAGLHTSAARPAQLPWELQARAWIASSTASTSSGPRALGKSLSCG